MFWTQVHIFLFFNPNLEGGRRAISLNIGINRSRKISGSEADGNFANLGEQVQRSEPVNCC